MNNISPQEQDFKNQLKTLYQLDLYPITQDGYCLFSAFAHQLYGTDDVNIRNYIFNMIVNILKPNSTIPLSFWEPMDAFMHNEYNRLITDNDPYGEDPEIFILSYIYNRPVYVFFYDEGNVVCYEAATKVRDQSTLGPPILLAQFIKGHHFDSLIINNNNNLDSNIGTLGNMRYGSYEEQVLDYTKELLRNKTTKPSSIPSTISTINNITSTPSRMYRTTSPSPIKSTIPSITNKPTAPPLETLRTVSIYDIVPDSKYIYKLPSIPTKNNLTNFPLNLNVQTKYYNHIMGHPIHTHPPYVKRQSILPSIEQQNEGMNTPPPNSSTTSTKTPLTNAFSKFKYTDRSSTNDTIHNAITTSSTNNNNNDDNIIPTSLPVPHRNLHNRRPSFTSNDNKLSISQLHTSATPLSTKTSVTTTTSTTTTSSTTKPKSYFPDKFRKNIPLNNDENEDTEITTMQDLTTKTINDDSTINTHLTKDTMETIMTTNNTQESLSSSSIRSRLQDTQAHKQILREASETRSGVRGVRPASKNKNTSRSATSLKSGSNRGNTCTRICSMLKFW